MKKIRIPLSHTQFVQILEEVLGVQRVYIDEWLRVEKPIKKEYADVEAIRVYLPELEKNINQTTERGEYPRFLIKRTLRAKTRQTEIEIVFMGSAKERHVEDLTYYEKHPEEWTTWGEIVLTPEQARKLIDVLKRMIAK